MSTIKDNRENIFQYKRLSKSEFASILRQLCTYTHLIGVKTVLWTSMHRLSIGAV